MLRPLKERRANGTEAGLVSERRRQRAETVGSLLRSITSLVIGVLALMLVLGEIGFNLGPFIAGAGIVGIAVAFGAQNVVKDFLSGIFMILEDQYGVGDVVDLGAASGTVEAVGLRVTRVRDGNGTLWYARNGEILRVGNKSKGFALVTVDLPVPYGSDVDAAGAAMLAAADELVARGRHRRRRAGGAAAARRRADRRRARGRAAADGEGAPGRPVADRPRAAAADRRPAGRERDPPARTATGWTCTPSRPGAKPAAPPADGSGGQPPTGPTDSDPTPR